LDFSYLNLRVDKLDEYLWIYKIHLDVFVINMWTV
jgi:hypothetical protein